jgi:two-component system chemotaxis sensor kinase CheA
MIEQAIEAFVLEATEILTDLEGQLLELEDSSTPAQIDEIFRALHTVKGSGSMFGYTALARFTHHFENAYERVRSGDLVVGKELVDLSLQAQDLMVRFLDLGGDGAPAEALLVSGDACSIIDRLRALTGEAQESAAEAPPAAPDTPDDDGALLHVQIRFRPLENALRNGMRPDLLVRELVDLGAGSVGIDISGVPRLRTLDASSSCLVWMVDLVTEQPRVAIDDVFIFADDADISITDARTTTQPAHKDLIAQVKDADAPSATAQSPKVPAPRAAKGQAGKSDRPADNKSENIRVASSRLDDMMDSLGELVIAQARLDAVAETIGDATLESVVEEVQRLVVGLRDATLSIRMLPIETVFGKFRRVVRDLSSDLNKDVRLITAGGETEVDKNVIDRIGDPLVHMIRNSVDHGLETAAVRTAAGKPAQGTVSLSARQEGGEILISIEDNGAGLNAQAIKEKALERGLISESDDLSERELHQLIFEPGFSTAQTISSVSGRGVGMDAVKTTIDALGGSISVASRTGQGTRITLRLPVTMAIIDGLRVRLGESIYVVPLSVVEECVEMDLSECGRKSGRSVLQIREHLVPYLALDDLFGQAGAPDARRRVVVVKVDGERVGLVVDDILGQSQTVIKSLSVFHRDIPGLGGATILGDGRVALIIDVATLVRWAEATYPRNRKKAA